ncbi:MAG TPA: VCBS repeat-containing protein [Polyangia bacterium]|nr:VCBS repeat-containing protein [Polyangia bacterium]
MKRRRLSSFGFLVTVMTVGCGGGGKGATTGSGGVQGTGGSAGGSVGSGGSVSSGGSGGSGGSTGSGGGAGGTCPTDGFASAPTAWSLPSFGSCAFDQGTSGIVQNGSLSYSTLDINGDGKPDLVVSYVASNCSPTVPAAQWLVYLNDGTGFSSTATPWSLPSFGSSCAFNQGTSGIVQNGSLSYSTLDMNGDSKPDLVVSYVASNCSPTVPAAQWLVYLNNGTGFSSTATPWSLPSFGSSCAFNQGASGIVQNGSLSYATLDITGDGKPDLVVSHAATNCSPAVPAAQWLVYPNAGTGFASTAIPWSLPSFGSSCAFDQGTSGIVQNGSLSYATLDITGGGKLDLVVSHAASNCSATVPAAQWLVYPSACQ